jgi:electron transport complex protein RnfC
MGLLPSLLSESMEAENVEQAEELCVMDCIECGSCAYECPAHRPLVQHMRHGKTRVLILRSKRAEAQKKGIPA